MDERILNDVTGFALLSSSSSSSLFSSLFFRRERGRGREAHRAVAENPTRRRPARAASEKDT